MIARHHRHAGLFHQPLGGILQPHGADGLGRGTDEVDAGRFDGIDEIRVLRQETVTGMDRLRARPLCRLDDPVTDEITLGRGCGADMHRFIRHLDMQRPRIGVRIDGDGGNAHAARGTDDAAGDLAPVCDQDLLEHLSSMKKAAKEPPHLIASLAIAGQLRQSLVLSGQDLHSPTPPAGTTG